MSDTCPHCAHKWAQHDPGRGCTGVDDMGCGCLWPDPTDIPPPPEPPSARDELIANIEDTIWSEFERQSLYVDREMDVVDGDVDMTAVAAVVAAIFVDSIDDCSWCHSPTAIGGWKLPFDVDQVRDACGGVE